MSMWEEFEADVEDTRRQLELGYNDHATTSTVCLMCETTPTEFDLCFDCRTQIREETREATQTIDIRSADANNTRRRLLQTPLAFRDLDGLDAFIDQTITITGFEVHHGKWYGIVIHAKHNDARRFIKTYSKKVTEQLMALSEVTDAFPVDVQVTRIEYPNGNAGYSLTFRKEETSMVQSREELFANDGGRKMAEFVGETLTFKTFSREKGEFGDYLVIDAATRDGEQVVISTGAKSVVRKLEGLEELGDLPTSLRVTSYKTRYGNPGFDLEEL